MRNVTMCLEVKVVGLVFDGNTKEWKNINHFFLKRVSVSFFSKKDKKNP
jgi:hypothetical protein